MTWLILRFYDISCARVDRVFYRMLLLLNSMYLKHLVRIWLHRYYILLHITSFYIIIDYILLYNLMCLEFWEGLHYFGLITCFTMLFFSYIIFLGFWERLHCFALRTYFILYFCYIPWVTIIFLLFIVVCCSVLYF